MASPTGKNPTPDMSGSNPNFLNRFQTHIDDHLAPQPEVLVTQDALSGTYTQHSDTTATTATMTSPTANPQPPQASQALVDQRCSPPPQASQSLVDKRCSPPPEATPAALVTTIRYDPLLLKVFNNSTYGHAGWNFFVRSPFYMLDFHRDRILHAAQYFQWDELVKTISGDSGLVRFGNSLEQLARKAQTGKPPPYRMRMAFGQRGFKITAITVPTRSLDALFPWKLSPPTEPRPAQDFVMEVVVDTDHFKLSPLTYYKTSHRQMYDDARLRLNITQPSLQPPGWHVDAAPVDSQPRETLLVTYDGPYGAMGGAIVEGSITTPYFWRNGAWVTPPLAPDNRYQPDPVNAGYTGGNYGTTRRWALQHRLAVEGVVLRSSVQLGEMVWLSNGATGFVYGIVGGLE
jgi:4-amino-4-deoxychorismate lyase